MRSKVKRLLKKYKYPPEEEQSALETVIKQCEQWADVNPDEYNDYENGGEVKEYIMEPVYHMAAEPGNK